VGHYDERTPAISGIHGNAIKDDQLYLGTTDQIAGRTVHQTLSITADLDPDPITGTTRPLVGYTDQHGPPI